MWIPIPFFISGRWAKSAPTQLCAATAQASSTQASSDPIAECWVKAPTALPMQTEGKENTKSDFGKWIWGVLRKMIWKSEIATLFTGKNGHWAHKKLSYMQIYFKNWS